MAAETMRCSLLLNANFEPLGFIDQTRVIKLLYKKKVEIIDYGSGPSVWNRTVNTIDQKIKVPATVRLKTRVKVKQNPAPRFSRKAVMTRDEWVCQYCSCSLSSKDATIDHVIPRSRGGENSWTNCVTSCKDCNTKKRDLTPEGAGLNLRKRPTIPSRFNFLSFSVKKTVWHPDWEFFIKKD